MIRVNKSKFYIIIITAVLIIICVLSVFGYNHRDKPSAEFSETTELLPVTEAQTTAENETTSPVVTWAETTSVIPAATETTSVETEPIHETPYISIIDFTMLQKINPDIYAWIEIPDTVISYPIVQRADDNTFYLDHSSDGSYYIGGAIFTENYNSKNFTDRNTVLYGHYMKDGSLFTGLHNFIDADFFAEHRYVYIYTPENTLCYEVFAVYPYDTRHLLLSFDYSNPYVFGKVFESIFKIRDMSARFSDDVTLDRENDLILTLSTCFYGEGTRRFLLQAVLVTD